MGGGWSSASDRSPHHHCHDECSDWDDVHRYRPRLDTKAKAAKQSIIARTAEAMRRPAMPNHPMSRTARSAFGSTARAGVMGALPAVGYLERWSLADLLNELFK